MRNAAGLLLFAAAAIQAAPVAVKHNDIDWKYEQKRQILGGLTSMMGKGGKVPDPPGFTSKRVEMTPRTKVPGSKSVKLRYGPYSVINMSKQGVNGEGGALWNYPDMDIPKPCGSSGECTVIGIQAGLEYPDGKNANIDTGMWLHHMVHFAIGPGRVDATCASAVLSLPHFDVGSSGSGSERIFSSGNERTPGILAETSNGSYIKAGFHIKTTDKFAFIVDLMNMNMVDKTVYVTMTYDYLDGFPEGYDDIKPVWFDVNQCGTSEVPAKHETDPYDLVAQPWKANFEGEVIGMAGHLHDGGATLQVMADGVMACDSRAKYGESREFLQPPAMQGMHPGDKMAEKHISSMVVCQQGNNNLGVTQLKKGQTWTITGKYDYPKYPGNLDHGKQSSVMAIAIMFVKVSRNGVGIGNTGVGGMVGGLTDMIGGFISIPTTILGGLGSVAGGVGGAAPAAGGAPTVPKGKGNRNRPGKGAPTSGVAGVGQSYVLDPTDILEPTPTTQE